MSIFFYDVTVVHLSGTEVSDLSPLASLKNLEDLFLSSTPVSDLSPLASLKNLTYLEVLNSKITKEEIDELQKALPECGIYRVYDY